MVKSLTYFRSFHHVTYISLNEITKFPQGTYLQKDVPYPFEEENQKVEEKGSEFSCYQWIRDVQRHAHKSKERRLLSPDIVIFKRNNLKMRSNTRVSNQFNFFL